MMNRSREAIFEALNSLQTRTAQSLRDAREHNSAREVIAMWEEALRAEQYAELEFIALCWPRLYGPGASWRKS